jgi:hypothetical protein
VSLRDTIVQADRAAFMQALDPRVVWVGVLPGMLCRDREQVVSRLSAIERAARPEIVADAGDRLVVDPHLDPPPDLYPGLHQVYVLDEDERIVEMRDYPDRESALAALETPW